MKNMRFQLLLIILLNLSNGFSQTLKVLDGDSIFTHVLFYENLDNYNNNEKQLERTQCVLISGDTVSLVDYIAQNFNYPFYCREHGYSRNRTFLEVKLKLNKEVDSVKLLRSYCQNEAVEIINLFENVKTVLVEGNDYLLVVFVNVVFRPLIMEKATQINIIPRRKNRRHRMFITEER